MIGAREIKGFLENGGGRRKEHAATTSCGCHQKDRVEKETHIKGNWEESVQGEDHSHGFWATNRVGGIKWAYRKWEELERGKKKGWRQQPEETELSRKTDT